jgi:response regulator of citrate/malate metabolism
MTSTHERDIRDHQHPQLLDEIGHNHAGLNIATIPMPSGRSVIRQLGVYDYLVKPVSRAILKQALSQFGDELGSIMGAPADRSALGQ